jgi:hypothetical protein
MTDNVKAERFYQDNGDKIKLNWFCYEYANNLYSAIKSSKKLAQYRAQHKPEQIADFCLYYSKRMRKSVYDKNAGKSEGVAVSIQYIYEYKPECPSKQAQALVEAAEASWDDTILGCTVCSNRCLFEWFELTPMFDNFAKTGWPT